MPFWTLRVLLTTQSVENCIPTLERAERSSQLSCGAPRQTSTLGVIEPPWPTSRARSCCRHHPPPANHRADR
ncbi:hypothetical protein CU661_17340 [Pseudomonas syringae pv. actinidifoliorum]|nr:hypothetical protein [Pseudomonas syringae pv. actinidifoliorum]